jgi:hypothetical protein
VVAVAIKGEVFGGFGRAFVKLQTADQRDIEV